MLRPGQVLEKWVNRGIISSQVLNKLHKSSHEVNSAEFSKQEVLKRMEDDWERVRIVEPLISSQTSNWTWIQSRRSKEESWRQECINKQFDALYDEVEPLDRSDVLAIRKEIAQWRKWKADAEDDPFRVIVWDMSDHFLSMRLFAYMGS